MPTGVKHSRHSPSSVMRNRVRVRVMIRVECNYIHRGVRTYYSLRVRVYEGGQ